MLSSFFRSKSRQERLWDACSYGKEETVMKLIREGANTNWRSFTNGNTALHHASMAGRVENGVMLLDAGTNVNAINLKDWTPLHNAAYWNQPTFAKLLLSRGANPHLKNKDGRTPLHELCRSKSRNSAIDLVENAKAILDRLVSWSGETNGVPTDEAKDPTTQHSSIVGGGAGGGGTNHSCHGLEERCECKNDWDREADFTPLLFACYHGHLELVEMLLDNGANLKATTKNGWTALHWAAQRCNADVVELLLNRGASRSVEDLRGDMACDVTNDIGLRDCLLPDPVYPHIVSNGHVTTDDEDGADDD